jgi:hypothetical protein
VKLSIPDPSRIVEASAESFTLKDFNNEVPDDSWDDDELVAYAKHQVVEIRKLKRQVAVHVYRLGMALSLYRKRHLEHGDWEKFLEGQGLSGPTAWRAVQLFERAESEQEVANLGITEAYVKFGILRRAKEKAKGTSSSTKVSPASGGTQPPAEVAPAVAASRTKPAESMEDEAVLDSGEAQPPEEEELDGQEEPEDLGETPDDEGDEAGAETLQPEDLDADTPPPKESWTAVSALVAAKRALEWLEEKITSGDWEQEDKDDYRSRLETIIEIAMRIEDALS